MKTRAGPSSKGYRRGLKAKSARKMGKTTRRAQYTKTK